VPGAGISARREEIGKLEAEPLEVEKLEVDTQIEVEIEDRRMGCQVAYYGYKGGKECYISMIIHNKQQQQKV
jgi:hypothetical protein